MRSEIELAGVPTPPAAAGQWRPRLLLPLAFTGGLASLGIEFAAARLLAPFFGQSLSTAGGFGGGNAASGNRRIQASVRFSF